MAGRLLPCASCHRHVRTAERSCPFCGVALEMNEPLEEWRLLTRLDRLGLISLGAVLSAAGIAIGCHEPPTASDGGAPSAVESTTAISSAEPPVVPPTSALSVPTPATPLPPAPSSSAVGPKPAVTAKPKSSAPLSAVAAYGAPVTRPLRER